MSAEEQYEQFIQEAFIDPIRSVLIIDDEYPTIEQILNSQINDQDAKTYKNPASILSVINGFRKDNPARIVDIHDGLPNEKEELANHLHQSDLLILDYELHGDKGEQSVQIVNRVLENNHFNLIVIHTSSEPTEPFESILLSLMSACSASDLDQQKVQSGKDAVDEIEDDVSGFGSLIQETVGFQQYIDFRNPFVTPSVRSKLTSGAPPFQDFYALIQKYKLHRKSPPDLLYWALNQYEQGISKKLTGNYCAQKYLRWSTDFNRPLWIRTNKGFIAFVQKKDSINLIDELRTSLATWKPSPSRLLSSKIRAEIDDSGVIAEDSVLSNAHIHAKFYQMVFKEKFEEARRAAVDEQIKRSIDDISNQIFEPVASFFNTLVDADTSNNEESIFLGNYGVNLQNSAENQTAIKRYNAHISCYPKINGWHLSPGHILQIGDEKWVCLSPVCDLVPSQKKVGVFGDVGSGKPFMAVKLHSKSKLLNSNQINSNNFIFISSKHEPHSIEQYGFYEQSSGSTDKAASPHWNLFFAKQGGKFEPDFKLDISRVGKDEHDNLKIDLVACEVVAQLRYEYALNLMQKLGGDFTRVGLEYISN